ncbi:MAG: hypothetical protein GWN39_02910 [Thermoplasmata archaeon]|nr:hypothetical protein [Thermoplasmata archaeon]NIS22165.1 hypothetical protein [Thermoplasmata archaeon]NIV77715.1 hypothetical protein [Thermoplasmata archaeon]NIW91028.1 hypothetical protein [Thermoplasmata archaeon]
MEKFIHIRSTMPTPRRMDGAPSRPGKAGVSICYRLSETNSSEQWVLVGWSLCPPHAPYWNRKKGVAISRARAYDSPVQFQFNSLDERLEKRHVLAAVRTFFIESFKSGPGWEEGDMFPIRPSRFTERWRTTFPGPSGSLMTAWIDAKPNRPPRDVAVVPGITPEVRARHWSDKVPSWARSLLEGE